MLHCLAGGGGGGERRKKIRKKRGKKLTITISCLENMGNCYFVHESSGTNAAVYYSQE